MKLSLIDVVQGSIVVNAIEDKLPFKLSWELSDIAEALKKWVKRFDEQRLALIKEYGEVLDAEKGSYKILDQKAFTEKIEELCASEVELDVEPLSFDSLERANLQIQPANMMILKKFCKKD